MTTRSHNAGFFTRVWARTLNKLLQRLRTRQGESLPVVELSAEHVQHLVVVPDRRALVARMPRGGRVAELGVADGDFSALILEIAQPDELRLIDTWQGRRYGDGQMHVRARFRDAIARGKVAVDVGLSTQVLARFDDAYFDWVYIDTDHTYARTRRELELAAKKVKAAGVIAGHDYVTGNWNSGMRYGVVEAVHEFCVQHGWELIVLTSETDRHLSFALRRLASA